MGAFANLLGTVLTTFGIGPKGARATIDASAMTAQRTFTLPDASGTLATTADVAAAGGSDVRDNWLFG